MLAYSEFFYLVHSGQGEWKIRHRITDESAGVVSRSATGFALFDDKLRPIGDFDTIEHALGELYAAV